MPKKNTPCTYSRIKHVVDFEEEKTRKKTRKNDYDDIIIIINNNNENETKRKKNILTFYVIPFLYIFSIYRSSFDIVVVIFHHPRFYSYFHLSISICFNQRRKKNKTCSKFFFFFSFLLEMYPLNELGKKNILTFSRTHTQSFFPLSTFFAEIFFSNFRKNPKNSIQNQRKTCFRIKSD